MKNTVAGVERLAQADRHHAARPEQWDSDPWKLNTAGGIVDLKSGQLAPHDRKAYCTKITAVAPTSETPELWLKFMAQITGGVLELQAFLQRMFGYALTGVISEHALFFLYGTGANGKSVLVSTLTGILGDYAKTSPIEVFLASRSEQHPTGLAGLQG